MSSKFHKDWTNFRGPKKNDLNLTNLVPDPLPHFFPKNKKTKKSSQQRHLEIFQVEFLETSSMKLSFSFSIGFSSSPALEWEVTCPFKGRDGSSKNFKCNFLKTPSRETIFFFSMRFSLSPAFRWYATCPSKEILHAKKTSLKNGSDHENRPNFRYYILKGKLGLNQRLRTTYRVSIDSEKNSLQP